VWFEFAIEISSFNHQFVGIKGKVSEDCWEVAAKALLNRF
jgi:hypothetical protein